MRLVNQKPLKIFIVLQFGGGFLSYLDKIDEYCAQHKISQTRFERDAGISKGLISKWRSGKNNPRMDSLQKAADHIGITFDDLMREDAADYTRHKPVPDSWQDGPDIVRDASIKYVPVYRYLRPDTEDLDPDTVEMHYAVMPDNIQSPEECFGYAISDSGMAPDIQRGDTIIVRRDSDPDTGDIVLVSTPGQETICRKLIRKDGWIILQPFNSHFDAVLYRQEELDLLPVFFRGKVVRVIRDVNSSSYSVPEL